MNLSVSRTWPEARGQADPSRSPKGPDRVAFQQVLRVMEKDMWAGAQSPGTAGKQPGTAQTVHPGPTRDHAHPIPGTVASSTENPGVGAPRATPAVRARAHGLALPEAQVAPARPVAANGPEQQEAASAIPICLASSAQMMHTPSAGREATRLPSDLTMPPAPQDARLDTPVKPPGAVGAVPYRLNVTVDAGTVSIVVRINGAASEDLDTLKQKALAEARRHGMHEVRLVINGIAQTSNPLPGAPYGY